MKIHAAMRRAVDLNNRGLKQNYDRDTTCVLRAVCEYKPLSHPHHCCQITSNLGSALDWIGRRRLMMLRAVVVRGEEGGGGSNGAGRRRLMREGHRR